MKVIRLIIIRDKMYRKLSIVRDKMFFFQGAIIADQILFANSATVAYEFISKVPFCLFCKRVGCDEMRLCYKKIGAGFDRCGDICGGLRDHGQFSFFMVPTIVKWKL